MCVCFFSDFQRFYLGFHVALMVGSNVMGLFESAPQKLIIDTDAGVDDALAIMMAATAHREGKVSILAITCIHGNTDIDNVTRNVFLTLEAVGSLQIPVYRGAAEALIHSPSDQYFFGRDGFGDADFPDPPGRIRKEHSVNVLLQLVTENPGEITLLALGPLTNIALAMKLDPDFISKLKDIHVMGGNVRGIGNVVPGAEFNFYEDAEAAHIVLSKTTKTITLFPWEASYLWNLITMEWRRNVLGEIPSRQVKLLNKAEERFLKSDDKHWIMADPMSAAALLEPNIIRESHQYVAMVEVHGNITRGTTIVDYLKNTWKRSPNINFIQYIDVRKYKKLLIYCLGGGPYYP